LDAEKAAKEKEKKRILERMMGGGSWGYKDRNYGRVADQAAKASKDAELEYYRNELFWGELEKKNREREKAEAAKRAKDREEMLAAYEYQMELKEKKRQEEEAQEARFREELMAKFAKDAKIEQMNDQRRRMKVLEHKREVDRLVEERKKRFDAEREKERKEHEELLKFDSVRKEVIAEERKRLLAEYGAELFEFLPKGTVQSEENEKYQAYVTSELNGIERDLKEWFLTRRFRMERALAIKKELDDNNFTGLSNNAPEDIPVREKVMWSDIVAGRPSLGGEELSVDAKQRKADTYTRMFDNATDNDH
ncbi:hypothetical protein FOZ63_008260, partial [Perkinsus olseni]